MSSHNHDTNDTTHYYEGDQSKLYSGIMSHHDDIKSPESKKQLKRITKILVLLSIITIVEVAFGLLFSYTMPRAILNTIFLVLTLLKAGYIVAVFMHLGDEVKSFIWIVLIPLVLFIWFIIAFLADGDFWLWMNNSAQLK
jgi:cytochrome c oxidase subunit IV